MSHTDTAVAASPSSALTILFLVIILSASSSSLLLCPLCCLFIPATSHICCPYISASFNAQEQTAEVWLGLFLCVIHHVYYYHSSVPRIRLPPPFHSPSLSCPIILNVCPLSFPFSRWSHFHTMLWVLPLDKYHHRHLQHTICEAEHAVLSFNWTTVFGVLLQNLTYLSECVLFSSALNPKRVIAYVCFEALLVTTTATACLQRLFVDPSIFLSLIIQYMQKRRINKSRWSTFSEMTRRFWRIFKLTNGGQQQICFVLPWRFFSTFVWLPVVIVAVFLCFTTQQNHSSGFDNKLNVRRAWLAKARPNTITAGMNVDKPKIPSTTHTLPTKVCKSKWKN